MGSGLRPIDLYFETRVAFLDRPDVRLRTYRDHARAGIVIEARASLAVVSFALDDHFMAVAARWAMRDSAETFRREFDYHEQWAETRALDKIRETRSVR